MKRQIITAVSRLTVLVFAAFSLCGCDKLNDIFTIRERPLYAYISCERLGWENKEFLSKGTRYCDESLNFYKISKDELNTTAILRIYRQLYDDNGRSVALSIVVDCGNEELPTNKRYSIESAVVASYTYYTYTKEDVGYVELTNIRTIPSPNGNGSISVLGITGEYEFTARLYTDGNLTMDDILTIKGNFDDHLVSYEETYSK